MPDFKLTTPVAFIIFNRPDTTELVFAEIAKAKPTKLLVIADGARANKKGDAEKVAATRAIINRIDWACEVLTNFSDVNLGCKIRVSSGIDWVFEQVEEAIILEDDCLPDPTFFRFCQELLEKYRDDQRVGMISGANFQFGQTRNHDSYYFSNYNIIWGWASWRRAWKHYDVKATVWPKFRDEDWLTGISHSRGEKEFWDRSFDAVFSNKIDTWDYQWVLTSMIRGALSVTPNINLISNIGFGPDATHTFGVSKFSNMEMESINFPLRHPIIFLPDRIADAYVAQSQFIAHSLFDQLRSFIFLLPVRIIRKICKFFQYRHNNLG